jgi:predicted PhzF superfamily epimerase YddE/YHI9
MRNVAREMNLSETAFLTPEADGFRLRWFTPAVEVDLCGHATLAAAHVLWEDGHLAPGAEARFHTRSGLLRAVRCGRWIELDFPVTAPLPAEAPPGLLAGLGVPVVAVSRSRFDYLVEVESEEAVRAIAPDFSALRKVEARGIVVTARASLPGFDFVSRFFAPTAGVDEDPVTGSSHCALALYWAARLGKTEMTAWQASARGGAIGVRLSGDRVILAGQAVTVMTGELCA